jgi:hypothetical protein
MKYLVTITRVESFEIETDSATASNGQIDYCRAAVDIAFEETNVVSRDNPREVVLSSDGITRPSLTRLRKSRMRRRVDDSAHTGTEADANMESLDILRMRAHAAAPEVLAMIRDGCQWHVVTRARALLAKIEGKG